MKHEIDSQMREIKSAQSSLERAAEQGVEEAKRNAGKSGYCSYSSANGRMRDANRSMENAISRLSNLIDKIMRLKDNLESGVREAERKTDEVIGICDNLEKELSMAMKQAESAKRKNEEIERERDRVKRELDSTQRERASVQRERDSAKQERDRAKTAAAASATAAAAAATSASHADRKAREAERRAGEDVANAEREMDALREENQELRDRLARACASAEKKTSGIKRAGTGKEMSEEYAELWNLILADDVIELDEVRQIREWVSKYSRRKVKELAELGLWCDMVIDSGEVTEQDTKNLYDCSMRLLDALWDKK